MLFFQIYKNYYMGFLRTGGKLVGNIVFITFLALLIMIAGLSNFTEYDNMKGLFDNVIGSQIDTTFGEADSRIENMSEEELEIMHNTLLEMCKDKDYIQTGETYPGGNIDLDCNIIREIEILDRTALNDLLKGTISETALNTIYYSEYECDVIECMQSGQFMVIFSEQGHEFLLSIQIYMIVGTVIGAAIIIAASNDWPDRLKSLGWPMVFTGFSYVLFEIGKHVISGNLSQNTMGVDIIPIMNSVMNPMLNSFLVSLGSGIILIAAGYVIQYKTGNPRKKKKS